MKISKILILQLFCNETWARKCPMAMVNRNQLHKSCMICNQLIQNNFPAAHSSRISAACITLSRNNCCFSNQNQESRPLKVNGHLLHLFALIWFIVHEIFYLVSSNWIKHDRLNQNLFYFNNSYFELFITSQPNGKLKFSSI